MNTIYIDKKTNNTVSIKCDDTLIIGILQSITEVFFTERVYQYWNSTYVYQESSNIMSTLITDNELELHTELLPLLLKDIEDANFHTPITIEINKKLNDFINCGGITINDKWLKIYKNNPKVDNSKHQLNTAAIIKDNRSGIIGLYPGCGKGEVLVGLADSYLETYDNNVLIIVFSNKVRDELILRCKQYGIKLTKSLDISRRFNIINPSGFSRSLLSKETNVINWMKNVELLIGDEGHHWSAETWGNISTLCTARHTYAFTATGEVEDGLSLLPDNLSFHSTPIRALHVVKHTGASLIEEDLPVPIDLLRVQVQIQTKSEVDAYFKANKNYPIGLINNLISEEALATLIAMLYKRYLTSGICFIPIVTVQSGIDLCNNLNKLGIRSVFWSGELAITPAGEANDELTLEVLKELGKDREFDILLTTSIGVEGIDIPNLNSIIPLTGVSFKNTIQSIGRSARSDYVKCILIYDKYCSILNRQMKTKEDVIRRRLNLVTENVLNLIE